MRVSKLFHWITLCTAFFSASAQAGDVDAGKAKVAQQCAECHRPADWDGETTAQLQSLLRDIAAGRLTHRKRPLQLTEQDIADIAAYWTSGRKK
jgi:mono/diheme cytochrome c family protein